MAALCGVYPPKNPIATTIGNIGPIAVNTMPMIPEPTDMGLDGTSIKCYWG